MRIPLYPLNVQLLPGGIIPLEIIEPRYLRMIAMSQQSGFGLCLIGLTNDHGYVPVLPLGTRVEVIDFNQSSSGHLVVTVQGKERYRLDSVELDSDGLLMAEVEMLPNWQVTELGREQAVLADKLGEIFEEHPDFAAYYPQPEWANACWVAQRWLEVLQIPAEEKLPLIESEDCSDALRFLMQVVQAPLPLH